jgi:hypothetical protein
MHGAPRVIRTRVGALDGNGEPPNPENQTVTDVFVVAKIASSEDGLNALTQAIFFYV